MQTEVSNNVILFIAVAVIFFVLATFITIIIVIYQRKQIQHANLTKELRETFQKELLKAQIEIQEETFTTISQEMHDGIGQMLSVVKVQMGIMYKAKQFDESLLQNMTENISKIMTDVRNVSRTLNSDWVKVGNISKLVEFELQKINRSDEVSSEIIVEGTERSIDEQKKLLIFRIVQESLQNILKHAHASKILVHFDYSPGSLKIAVTDNGRGFDQDSIDFDNEGMGLKNIVRRAAILKGTAVIESKKNSGTAITITLPYESD